MCCSILFWQISLFINYPFSRLQKALSKKSSESKESFYGEVTKAKVKYAGLVGQKSVEAKPTEALELNIVVLLMWLFQANDFGGFLKVQILFGLPY